jgi:hypothetical protein
MAPYDWVLTDQDVADVVSFIQTSWGNAGEQQGRRAAQACELIIIPTGRVDSTSSSLLIAPT